MTKSRITDEMIERFLTFYGDVQKYPTMRRATRAALEAVEAGLCEPGPFVLSEREERAFTAIFEFAGDGHDAYIEAARGALDRALRTLGPVQERGPFVLREHEERALNRWRKVAHAHEGLPALFQALDRALRTLGPQPAQGGEWTLDDGAKVYLTYCRKTGTGGKAMEAALNECFPRGKVSK